MAKLYVEQWAPDYGSPFEADEAMAPVVGSVDAGVEVDGHWAPVPGRDDGVPVVAFVDGVRRVDARVTVDDPAHGPVPGICGSYGVGAVLWRRTERRSEVVEISIDRIAVLAGGRDEQFPVAGPQLAYRTETVPDTDPAALIRHFHGAMRSAESRLAEDLAHGGYFVVADGPLNELSGTDKVGYVKSHRAPYLPPEKAAVVAALAPGERTPLFEITTYPRYSWYLRLAVPPGGHSWTGVVRCEVAAAVGLARARLLADRTAALLPAVGSQPHVDPRAPQNLVPIAALERELRRRLGDPAFVHRQLQAAAARQAVAP